MQILRANVRDPLAAEGDLYSLAACNQSGCESLLAILEEFELPDLTNVGNMIIGNPRTAMLSAILQPMKKIAATAWSANSFCLVRSVGLDLH
jgi:N-methylhydantoinase B/oxoprolinase/acetone carboxylase alpha subunit